MHRTTLTIEYGRFLIRGSRRKIVHSRLRKSDSCVGCCTFDSYNLFHPPRYFITILSVSSSAHLLDWLSTTAYNWITTRRNYSYNKRSVHDNRMGETIYRNTCTLFYTWNSRKKKALELFYTRGVVGTAYFVARSSNKCSLRKVLLIFKIPNHQ